jgi:hypothetical protein
MVRFYPLQKQRVAVASPDRCGICVSWCCCGHSIDDGEMRQKTAALVLTLLAGIAVGSTAQALVV